MRDIHLASRDFEGVTGCEPFSTGYGGFVCIGRLGMSSDARNSEVLCWTLSDVDLSTCTASSSLVSSIPDAAWPGDIVAGVAAGEEVDEPGSLTAVVMGVTIASQCALSTVEDGSLFVAVIGRDISGCDRVFPSTQCGPGKGKRSGKSGNGSTDDGRSFVPVEISLVVLCRRNGIRTVSSICLDVLAVVADGSGSCGVGVGREVVIIPDCGIGVDRSGSDLSKFSL